MNRKKGQRVFMEFEHKDTGETKRRWGTVVSDEIPFWDYTDVQFDDLPGFTVPVICWYLFDEVTADE